VKDEPVREERVTIIQERRRGGGGGIIVAIVLLFLAGAIAFFFLGGYFEKAADKTDIDVDVNIATPKIDLPDVHIDRPAPAGNRSGD
jgi:hypothetical protein